MSSGLPHWIAVVLARLIGAKRNSPVVAGPLGTPLAEFLKSSGLFGWFHFTEAGRQDLPEGKKIVSFKPSGEAFHKLVTLEVTVNASDVIQLLKLIFVRSFIDNSRSTVFAADLAKSFLHHAPIGSERDPIAALAQEINARSMARSGSPILTRQPLPEAKGPSSNAYLVYENSSEEGKIVVRNSERSMTVSLQNRKEGETPVLEMTMSMP